MKNIKDKSEVNKFNILRMHAKSCKIAAAQVHIKHKRNAIILIITIAKGIKFVMIKSRENFSILSIRISKSSKAPTWT